MKNLMEKETKCLLVHPKCSINSYWNYVEVCNIAGAKYPAAPLGLMTAAALLPQQWQIKLIDTNVEPLLDEHLEWADIVGTGGMLPQQSATLSIIERAHQFGRPVIIGGPDPSSQPNLYQSSDYLVLGEGEISIPLFIQALEKGCSSGEFRSDEKADMAEAVIPRFDLIRFKDYIQVGIQCTRGCPFNCEFCDVIEIFGRKPRSKSPAQIIKELQTLYDLGHRGHIDFVDDNFIVNKKNTKKVLLAIKEWSEINNYPYYFSTESSINLANDENLLQMMKEVDFRYVFIGIETPDNKILELTQKKLNVNRDIVKSVKKINSHGMIVNAGFIIGFDNEGDDTAENMIKFIQETGICMAMLGRLYALPNTQLTRRLHKEGRLFEEGSRLKDINTEIDQLSSGPNFLTTRARLDILKDYVRIIKYIYDPQHYYERIIYTGLNLRPANKYQPSMMSKLKMIKAFLTLCQKVGFNKITGRLYWKMLVTIIFKNPKAIEATVNLAAMFIHFHKQSKFIIDLTNKEISNIENYGEDKYNQLMLQAGKNSNIHQEPLTTMVNE
jgi:radical SAM superfamily enzyme YgiQ (UPF0313 family)